MKSNNAAAFHHVKSKETNKGNSNKCMLCYDDSSKTKTIDAVIVIAVVLKLLQRFHIIKKY